MKEIIRRFNYTTRLTSRLSMCRSHTNPAELVAGGTGCS